MAASFAGDVARLRVTAPVGAGRSTGAGAVGVDREAKMLRGYVVAQVGPFKSPGRGEFDRASLDSIVSLGNGVTGGIRAHFQHASLCSDSLGKYLGRSRRFRLSTTTNAAGLRVEAVRADLHFDPTALDTPPSGGKPLGLYVMDLAESDPGALSSSIVVQAQKEYRLNKDGTRQRDAAGEDLPPLWRPDKLTGSDIVAEGDAVDDLLSTTDDTLPDAYVWEGAAMMGRLLTGERFGRMSRREVRDRLSSWVDRILDQHFGPERMASTADMVRVRQRMRELEAGIY